MELNDSEIAVVKLVCGLAETKNLKPKTKARVKALQRKLEMWALGMED